MTSVIVTGRALDHNLGGNTTYVRNVYQRLRAHGIDYQMIYPSVRPKGRRRSAIVYAAWEAVAPVRCAERVPAGLVHFPTDTGGLHSTGRVPVVATIHGVASLHSSGIRSPLRQAVWTRRAMRMARIADCIVTDSRSSAEDLCTAFTISDDRVVVVPLGVDHGRFNPGAASGDMSELAMPATGRYALYLGNLEPRKNIVSLIQAFERPQLRRLRLPLVIAGRPAWSYSGILAEIDRSPNVHYLGAVPDHLVAPLIAQSDVFVFPSLYEGFGLPVLEAMACGVPVVTSDRGALPETTGAAAQIVHGALDPSSIASAVEEVVCDSGLRDRLSLAGRRRAALFTWEATAEAHAKLFHDIGNGPHSSQSD